MDSQNKDALNILLLLLLYVVLGIFIFYAIIFGTLIATNGIDSISSKDTDLMKRFGGNSLLSIQLLSHIFGLIIPAFILTKSRNSVNKNIGTLNLSSSAFLFSFGLLLLSLPILNLLTYINLQIPLPEYLSGTEKQLENLIKDFLKMDNLFDLIIRILIIGLIPAIGEEWIFRGIIQNQFIRLFKSQWTGLILASIVFSGIHMQFQGFLPRFALGIILGYTYIRSGSLIQPIFLHFIFNSVQVIMVYFLGIDQLDNQMNADKDWTTVLLLSTVSVPLLYFFFQKFKNKPIDIT